MDATKVPFGLATITIDEGGTEELVLDGVNYFQAEGGELNLEPSFEDIVFQDWGTEAWDQRLVGYNGELTLVLGQNDIKIMQKAFAHHSEVVDGTTSEVVGVTDAKIGQSMREKAVKVRIHPREMGADTSMDIVIYKMAGVGPLTRTYETAQGNYETVMKAFPRDGGDPTKPGNYYYIGDTDPNETAS